MSMLYPQILWLLIPLGLFVYYARPRTLQQRTYILILALLLLSLARPQLEKGLSPEQIKARDILIALDVSYSMRAHDIAPDRYTYAKETIDALLEQDAKDNIMLIAFTTNPLLLSPPTTDHRLIHTALEALDVNHILTKGTSLKRLFQKIAQMKRLHREMILITDGGETRDLQPLIDALGSIDVHLNILALGTEHGATIPDKRGTLLRDKSGHLVISRINPLLRKLADTVNGTYMTAEATPAQSAKTLMSQIRSGHEASQHITKQRYANTEMYDIPLLLALVLFVMLHTRLVRYLILLYALLGIPLHASFFDFFTLKSAYTSYQKGDYPAAQQALKHISEDSLQKTYALANTYYQQGAYQKAITYYRSIRTRSIALKRILYYNIANAYAKEGKYDKAKIYYTKSLQLGEDKDARYNLALIYRLQKRQSSAEGRSLPKPQGGDAAQGKMEKSDTKKEKPSQHQRASGSGSGGQQRTQERDKKGKLIRDDHAKPQPLGSKVYELINKGYVHETQPW